MDNKWNFSLDDFYRVIKIECYWKKSYHTHNNIRIAWKDTCTKLYFDKNIRSSSKQVYSIILNGYKDIISFYNFSQNYCMIGNWNYNKFNIKERDYVYIDTENVGLWQYDFYKERLWNFLGNLKNPDLQLIELCTYMLNI